ncbi:MAG: M48 family metallopeptidase [Lentisphaerae bacterium]|nr:M48 family metallopeptidase [Lentisphaerota bacterium]
MMPDIFREYFEQLRGQSVASARMQSVDMGVKSFAGNKEASDKDLSVFRFPAELMALGNLERKTGLRDYYYIFEDNKELEDIRRNLLGNSIRMNEILAPRLYNICREVSGKTGYGKKIEFYISPYPEVNAVSINGFNMDRDMIILTPSLIKLMSDQELKFVIGHEIGHLVFKHSVPGITYHRVFGGRENFNSVRNNLKNRWDIYAEISADRVGYFAVDDIRTVGRTFFKLSSGLPEEYLNFNLDEYMKQLDEIDPAKSGYMSCESHPANLIRLKCLELFSSSSAYFKFTDKPIEGIPDDILLGEEMKVLLMRESEPKGQMELEMAKMIGAAGMILSLSDDEMIEKEYDSTYDYLLIFTSMPESYMEFDTEQEALEQLYSSCSYWADINNSKKFDLFKALIWIALGDNKISENQKVFLNEIGSRIKIPEKDITDYIRQIVMDKNR